MSDFLTHEEVTQLLQSRCPELEASYQFTKAQIAELEYLRDENAHLRSSYDAACVLVAQMHEVVMGKVVGPHHGVVEDVRNKVAEQAAVIERFRNELYLMYLEEYDNKTALQIVERDFPTDSTQVLQEWLDTQLGEPVAWESEAEGLTYENHYSDNVPLFKKPEL